MPLQDGSIANASGRETTDPLPVSAPLYTVNQSVLIQYRADIWVPGVVIQHFFCARYSCLATEVEFYQSDGSRTRGGFLDKDIRPADLASNSK
ncbi:hypothetical protein C8Q77DRAFT_1155695 [Trametes polyzona]|nr:hypothetical protein C8Q77DRAFT_1155695 [Trametes polyzona]